ASPTLASAQVLSTIHVVADAIGVAAARITATAAATGLRGSAAVECCDIARPPCSSRVSHRKAGGVFESNPTGSARQKPRVAGRRVAAGCNFSLRWRYSGNKLTKLR